VRFSHSFLGTDVLSSQYITLPVTTTVLKVLHLDKAHYKSEKIPSVTITIGDVSVTVPVGDLKDAQHAATNIARKLIKEHPEALPSTIVNVSGKLIEPPTQSTPPVAPDPKQIPAPPRRKPHKKRTK
jgi:hypothetical protein